ncbi:nucleoside hydrolase [Clostridium sp. 'deep sea']|uniref:nucleoside hydrolase n=1 Tax=Clostridium sp. 'deep sea' TaxID=2779445 RepID=UPI001896874D|nr:nucleoside hydrolase [Clostridium sp. 'deep sea']QOR35385.1 nucleoside hydrolase [Clostridium sp. 'deep sea']
MKHIIIDCDPGHDDAIALLLALAHKNELKIELITTIGGNQSLNKVTINALKVLELTNNNIEVAKGQLGPLVRPLTIAPEAHGDTGMNGPILPNPQLQASAVHAVKRMAEVVQNSKHKITLVPLGPLTNIALFIKSYPHLLNKIELISLMGGGLYQGNVTSAAEFNIYVDPEAAAIVFKSGLPLIMSGLDVTNKAYILNTEYESLRSKGKISNFVCELLDFYSIYGKRFGYTGNAMHDPCAIAYLLQPQLFKAKDLYVQVITDSDSCRGQTLADNRPKPAHEPNVKVLLDIDREFFVQLLFDAFSKLDNTCS